MKKKKLFFIIPVCLLSGIIAILLLIFTINKNDVTEKEHQDFVAYKTQLLAANGISETDDGIYYVPFFTDTDGKTWSYNKGRYLVLNEKFLTEKEDGYSFNTAGTFDIYAENPLSGVGTGNISSNEESATEETIDASIKIKTASISKCIIDLNEFMNTNTYSKLIFKNNVASVNISWSGYTAGDTCGQVKITAPNVLKSIGENQTVNVLIYAGPILANFTSLSVTLLDSNGRVIGHNIDSNGNTTGGSIDKDDSNEVRSDCILALGYNNADVSTVIVYSETANSSKWGKIIKPTDSSKIEEDKTSTISWNIL